MAHMFNLIVSNKYNQFISFTVATLHSPALCDISLKLFGVKTEMPCVLHTHHFRCWRYVLLRAVRDALSLTNPLNNAVLEHLDLSLRNSEFLFKQEWYINGSGVGTFIRSNFRSRFTV